MHYTKHSCIIFFLLLTISVFTVTVLAYNGRAAICRPLQHRLPRTLNMTYLKLKYFQLSVTYFVLTGSLFEHSRRSPSTAQVGRNDLSIGHFFISMSCCGNLRVLEFCPLMTTWSAASEWLPYNAFLTCRNELSRCGYKFFRCEKSYSIH